jgi:hypothetical protein
MVDLKCKKRPLEFLSFLAQDSHAYYHSYTAIDLQPAPEILTYYFVKKGLDVARATNS